MAARDGTGSDRTFGSLIRMGCIALVCCLPGTAGADPFLDRANQAAAATSGTKPAHETLMPALAAMTEPPVGTGWSRDDLLPLLMVAPGEPEWASLEAWADAEPQKAALEALATITADKERYIIGFGYGREAVPPEWADAGLFVGLTSDGLLHSATFPYLERVGWLVGLAAFEAARAGSAGDGERALTVCVQTVRLGRILTERAYLREVLAGASIMLVGLERLRDVMYQFESAFTADKLKEAAERLDDLRIREKRLPMANYLAAEQIIARTYAERGGVDGSALSELMSGARTQSRPLARLSEAAFWAEKSGAQADWFETTDKLKGVWADWEKRWKLADFYDPLFDIPSDFRKMDPNRFLTVFYPLNGVESMFDTRLRVLVEIGGTINAIGCVGFRVAQKTTPPQLASVTPTYIARLSPDLLHVDRRQMTRRFQPFTFWVPIRDQKWDRRQTPRPYEITVAMVPGGGGMGQSQQDIGEAFVHLLKLEFLGATAARPDAGVIDAAALKIDADRFRQHLLGLVENAKWESSQLKEINRVLKMYAKEGITTANFDERYDAWFAEHGADARATAARVGLDVEATKGIVKDIARALLGNETVTNAISNAENSDELRTEDAKKLLTAYIETTIQPVHVDRITDFIRAFREEAERAIESAGGVGLPTTVFTTEVGDDQFLLYSVGPNGVDDRARFVGPSGTDMLMWPPILSLQREARSAK